MHRNGRRILNNNRQAIWSAIASVAINVFILCAAAQTPIDIQPIKELKPTDTLATCAYRPLADEMPFFSRLNEKERTNDTAFGGNYTIHGKSGTYIAWFGIVRGIASPVKKGSPVTLLVQHHFFDGMTDCHMMLVAKSGDGDFTATLNVDPAKIPALGLVRIYGTVTSESARVPEVAVDYLRVWPWLTFTFTDLAGPDHSNPRWQKFSKFKLGGRIYSPNPDENYYLNLLGDPAEFGVNLKPD